MNRVAIMLITALLLVSCGSSDSTSSINTNTNTNTNTSSNTTIEATDTSAVAGLWDFSSEIYPGIMDEQYVHINENGLWSVYVNFPDSDGSRNNCYDKQVVMLTYKSDHTYIAKDGSGNSYDVEISVEQSQLKYKVYLPGRVDQSIIFNAPSVVGIDPSDLQLCDS